MSIQSESGDNNSNDSIMGPIINDYQFTFDNVFSQFPSMTIHVRSIPCCLCSTHIDPLTPIWLWLQALYLWLFPKMYRLVELLLGCSPMFGYTWRWSKPSNKHLLTIVNHQSTSYDQKNVVDHQFSSYDPWPSLFPNHTLLEAGYRQKERKYWNTAMKTSTKLRAERSWLVTRYSSNGAQ